MDGTTLITTGVQVIEAEGLRYVFAAGAVSLLFVLTRRWTAATRIQSRRASLSDVVREIRHSMMTVVIFGLTGALILTLRQANLSTIDLLPPNLLAGAAQAVLLIVSHDAYFYWMHRALHSRRLFKLVHAVHHKSRTPTPWASYSFSALEAVAQAAILPLFLLLVPLSVPVIFFFLTYQMVGNAFGHCGHELMPSGFTRHWATKWFTTSTHHNLHHSDVRCNYGLYFTWWDRLMGTEHPQYHERFEGVALPWLGRRTAR